MTLTTHRKLRLSKGSSAQFASWKEGVSFERDAGKSLDDLRLEVAAGRFRLAAHMREHAEAALRKGPPLYRCAISRYYYAMYHALRAAAYVHHKGDEHEAHSVLPGKLPSDFPSLAHWSNQLKSAREHRNNADYDPFPFGTLHWKKIASILRSDALTLLPIARLYLRTKGCPI